MYLSRAQTTSVDEWRFVDSPEEVLNELGDDGIRGSWKREGRGTQAEHRRKPLLDTPDATTGEVGLIERMNQKNEQLKQIKRELGIEKVRDTWIRNFRKSPSCMQ